MGALRAVLPQTLAGGGSWLAHRPAQALAPRALQPQARRGMRVGLTNSPAPRRALCSRGRPPTGGYPGPDGIPPYPAGPAALLRDRAGQGGAGGQGTGREAGGRRWRSTEARHGEAAACPAAPGAQARTGVQGAGCGLRVPGRTLRAEPWHIRSTAAMEGTQAFAKARGRKQRSGRRRPLPDAGAGGCLTRAAMYVPHNDHPLVLRLFRGQHSVGYRRRRVSWEARMGATNQPRVSDLRAQRPGVPFNPTVHSELHPQVGGGQDVTRQALIRSRKVAP